MHVHKNTCTHTCPRTLTNWCWFLSFRVLISSVNHEFIRETADRLSIISLLKWCSNMYKNFLYKIICIWFTTQAFTIIISVNKGNRRSSSKTRFTNQNLKLWNHTNVYTETLKKQFSVNLNLSLIVNFFALFVSIWKFLSLPFSCL